MRDIIQLVSVSGKTGVFHLEDKAHHGRIWLSDGRIVPYGPGVICEPSCEGATEPEGNNRKRVGIAVLVIGGILGSSLLLRSSSFVGGTSTASGPNPKPSEPPVSSIPEPGTLVLLGAGLLLVSRKLK